MERSRPRRFAPTAHGLHDGDLVVRTPHATKTLRGDATPAIGGLLDAATGDAAASDLVAEVDGAGMEHVELLYDENLLYDARALPAGVRDSPAARLFEPTVRHFDPSAHHRLPDLLGEVGVGVYGRRDVLAPVRDRLEAAGVAVGSDPPPEADRTVVLLSEVIERDDAWETANAAWRDRGGTALRVRLTETGWRVGPVLTEGARACLNCLYTRVDANGAGGRLFTTTHVGTPPHHRAYVDLVTRLVVRTGLRTIPRYLDERVVAYDDAEQSLRTPRVLAVPHCEVCDGG